MKNYTKILAILFALVGIISLQSCTVDESPVSSEALYTSTNTVAYDLFADNNVGVISPSALNVNNDIMALEVPPPQKNPFGPYGFALMRMNLTEEQKASLSTAAQEYIDCITAATSAIRDAEKAIMDQLKSDVTAIIEQVKAGTLDKAAAREQIKVLQEATKTAMQAIPGREEAKAAAKDCFTKYDAAVRATLTEEQVKLLDQFLTKKGDPGKGKGKGDDNKGKGKGKATVVTGPLGKVLVKLNLDSLQTVGVNDAAKVYKDCYQLAMAAVREQEKVIMDALKTQRDGIIAQVKAGTMTREEAQTALKAAEENAKVQMAAIPGRTEAEAAAKKCYDSYLATVKGLLRPDQLKLLEDILASGTGTTDPTKP